ncbi:MAG TPA: hypothetical protein VJM46_05530 [Candidatus Saccharimonadales bacterium]|nr:hypothetical protein [Candidatus Saccharimonadales bacterium]
MLVSPHVTAGAALGAVIGHPILVIPFAIASHFILDSVPHWQETLAPYQPTKKTFIRIPIDLAIGLAVILLAVQAQPQHAIAIWVGALFASGADLDVLFIVYPKLKRGILHRYYTWHCAIQRETASLWGIVPQVAVIMVGLATIYQV